MNPKFMNPNSVRCSASLKLRYWLNIVILLVLVATQVGTWALSQVLPEGSEGVPFECPSDEDEPLPETQEELEWLQERERYRAVLPAYFAAMPEEPVSEITMPVEGIRVRDVVDTWGAARSEGRSHEGTDIFAPQGTPVYAATEGYIYRIGDTRRGGQTIVVVGAAGWRYYYAHLSAYADDIAEGQFVAKDTLLGYVGNTGNAAMTPPHLHLGIYISETGICEWDAINPMPFFVDRDRAE